MTRKYKKIIVTTSFLLLFILCLSFLLSFFVNFSGSSNFLINGFAFKNNESLNISLDKEYKFTSKKEINFLDVKVNFYANANYKYEFDGVPCDFIDLYDLESYEKGEGKNINSAFYIKREKDSLGIYQGTQRIAKIKDGIIVGFNAGNLTYQLRGEI